MREDTQMSMNVRLRTRRPGCSPGASGGSDSSGNVGDNFTPVQTGSAPVSHFPGHPEPFFWRAQSDCRAGPGFSSAPEPPGRPLCLSALGTQRGGKGLGQVRPPPGRMAVPPAGKGSFAHRLAHGPWTAPSHSLAAGTPALPPPWAFAPPESRRAGTELSHGRVIETARFTSWFYTQIAFR